MIYAAFIDSNKEEHSNLYYNFEDFHRDTFSPETEIISLIEFKTHGKSYAERKASAEETARRFQAENIPGLSWGEISEICGYFETVGKKYGLLTEFKENAII